MVEWNHIEKNDNSFTRNSHDFLIFSHQDKQIMFQITGTTQDDLILKQVVVFQIDGPAHSQKSDQSLENKNFIIFLARKKKEENNDNFITNCFVCLTRKLYACQHSGDHVQQTR